MVSRTLEHADAVNRPILEAALVDHDKHYRGLCLWIQRTLKTRWGKTHLVSGPNALDRMLSEGHTAATVIWETYAKDTHAK